MQILVRALLAPLSRSEFMDRCWNQRCVLIKDSKRCVAARRDEGCLHTRSEVPCGGRLAHVFTLLSDCDVAELCALSDKVVAWSGVKSEVEIRLSEESARVNGGKLYNEGAAIYTHSNVAAEALVGSVIKGLQLFHTNEEASLGEVEIFAGHAGTTTDWHWDAQHNFTMQLTGTKLWKLRLADVKSPPACFSPHIRSLPVWDQQAASAATCLHGAFTGSSPQSSDEFVEITLHPGDIFYHPPGVWHRVDRWGHQLTDIKG